MGNIFLIRHPEIVNHKARRFYGWTDIGLSQIGLDQATRLISRLSREKISLVYSSDLYRAHYPASLLAQSLNISHISLCSLREIHFGRWEGLTYEEIEKADPDLCRRWMNLADDFRFPDGESIAEFSHRILQGYEAIIRSAAAQGKNIAVITHGGVIRTLLGQIVRSDLSKGEILLQLDFASISTLQYDESQPEAEPPFRLIAVNEVSHLSS